MLKNVRKSLRVHVFQIVQKSVKYGQNGSIQTGSRKTTERVINQVVIMINSDGFAKDHGAGNQPG